MRRLSGKHTQMRFARQPLAWRARRWRYPVDARGLSISTSIDSQETMREMARGTGGPAYVNQNEIKYGVERAFKDEAATYTLGYYPENKKWDGQVSHHQS